MCILVGFGWNADSFLSWYRRNSILPPTPPPKKKQQLDKPPKQKKGGGGGEKRESLSNQLVLYTKMERNKRFLMLLKIYSVCYNNRLMPSHRQTTFEKIIAGNMCHSWMDEMHELFKGWHYLWRIQRQCAIEYVSCGNLYMCMFQCYLCFNDNHSFRDLWWSNVTPRYTKSSTIYISFFQRVEHKVRSSQRRQ